MVHSSEVHGQSRASEYLDGWQRARAELNNYRRRMQEEKEMSRQKIKKEVVTSLLSLSDNFQSMVAHLPVDLAEHGWAQGVRHVARQLETVLDEYGLQAIKGEGEVFNPRIHEAMSQEKVPGVRSGQVVQVLQVGYRLGNEVVRPAKVKIAE